LPDTKIGKSTLVSPSRGPCCTATSGIELVARHPSTRDINDITALIVASSSQAFSARVCHPQPPLLSPDLAILTVLAGLPASAGALSYVLSFSLRHGKGRNRDLKLQPVEPWAVLPHTSLQDQCGGHNCIFHTPKLHHQIPPNTPPTLSWLPTTWATHYYVTTGRTVLLHLRDKKETAL
jgi:hypothetical protein